jgi:hypothetical protein
MEKERQTGCVLPFFTFSSRSSKLIRLLPQWKTPYIPVLLAVSIILFVVFWYYERYLEQHTSSPPLMRTSIWFKGRFAVMQLIGALGWSSFASYSTSSALQCWFSSPFLHSVPYSFLLSIPSHI